MVGGLGGCFRPSDYYRPAKQLQRYAKRHYTRDAKEKILIARQVFEELPLAYQKRLVVDSKTELFRT